MELSLPNVLLIGAGKAGSTLIWDSLNKHPQIEMSRVKEPDFFSVDTNWERGLGWYKTNFNNRQDPHISYVGEASNSYSAIDFYPYTIERILSVIPNPKIIYTVRNPCKRVESDYMEYTLNTSSCESFSSYIRNNELSAAKNRYWRNYCSYSKAFGKSNIQVIFFEELVTNPSITLKRLFEFLDLEASGVLLEIDKEPKRATNGLLMAPSALRKLRRSRGYNYLSRLIPESAKKMALKTISKKKFVERPAWEKIDIKYFSDKYSAETKLFLKEHGMNEDYWSLDQPANGSSAGSS